MPLPLLTFFIALIPMLAYGGIDLVAARFSRAVGALAGGFVVQVGAFVLTLMLAPLFLVMPATIDWFGLGVMGITGVLFYVILFRALASGAVSIVAPITASWGAITALLSMWLLHEPATPLKIASALAVSAGVILLSIHWDALRGKAPAGLLPGVIPALIVALGWGVTYVYQGVLVREMGWYFTTLGTRIVVVLCFLPIFVLQRKSFTRLTRKAPWKFGIALIVLDVLAYTAYNLALSYGSISIASVVASASPLVSVLLAHFFLHERLGRAQQVGVGVVLVGLIGLQF